MEEKYGVEAIKDVAKFCVELGENVQDKLADDGKIKFMEYVGIVVDAFPDAFKIIKNGEQLKNEWLDFSENEKFEVSAYVADELNLESDVLEAKIEKGFEMLMAIDTFIREWNPYEQEED